MAMNRLETDRLEGLWSASADQSPEAVSEDAKLSIWAEQIEHFLMNHPRTLVISAVAVGICLGWLGKRK